MTRRLLIGLLMAGALVVGVGAAPAAAHTTDPWTGADTVCLDGWCVNTGNLVWLWQSILYVDGNFTDLVDIDGQFGGRTHFATQDWQGAHGIGSDGKAGPRTWGTARQQLVYDHSVPGSHHQYHYQGRTGLSFQVRQRLNGCCWTFRNPRTGAWLDTSHGA